MSRETLLAELVAEIRAGQRATDEVDGVVTELLGINRTDGRCLDVLEERGRMSAGELARAARLTTGAITSVVDRLERAGYVRRVADPEDRRRVLIEPTPEVFAATGELMRVMGEEGRPMLERYSEEQLEVIVEFTRLSRELQERHADWLRQKLTEGWRPPQVRASEPRRRGSRTQPG